MNNFKEKDVIHFEKNNQNNEDDSGYNININQNMNIEKNNDLNIMKEILDKKDFELSSLGYKEALKLDHRSYCQYYISSLKYNHPILFSFGTYDDYNSKIIKIFLFFFSFCLDFTINALFFTDDTMHKIYQDKGQFNFLYQIPQILYSTLISRFIDALIKNLALTQDNIVELKQEKQKNNLEKKYKKVLKIIRIKIISFFVIAFIILLFFWYYVICFCGIYVNTQIHLIKDSIISFITSFVYSFMIYLIPGLFRIAALRMENHSGKYLYKFSSFLENNLA